ncbi:MAG: sporulation protein [Clostridiales bacterium]|nr:sporulation protein [Clostridiales bacterium]
MAENNFESTASALFNGASELMSTKTVVGDAVHIGDTIILPLVDVSFGMGAGNMAGGLGGKMSPSAVLVINNGSSKIVNIKNQDSLSRIIDMVPDIINKFTKSDKKKEEVSDTVIIAAAKDSVDKM